MTYKFTINHADIEHKTSEVVVIADSLEEARRKAENLDIDEWLNTDNYDTEDLTKVQLVADRHFDKLCEMYNKAFHSTESPIEPFIILQEFKKVFEEFFNNVTTQKLATIDDE